MTMETISNRAVNPVELQAMLVSHDQEMIVLFSDMLGRMGIGVQGYTEETSAITRLGSARFEAVVLDFDTIGDAASLVARVRESPSSKSALIFGVASNHSALQCALEQGINFAFERPLRRQQIKTILHTAYGLMLRERRRYFRYAISAPVRLRRASGAELQCSTINISRNGTALSIPSPLELGESLEINFVVPEVQGVISARGSVIWDDKHGKAGLRFDCSTIEDQNRLTTWLDSHFYQQFNQVIQ